jgi:hypothetical protein
MRGAPGAIRKATARRSLAGLAGAALVGGVTALLAGTGAESLAATTTVSIAQGSFKLTPSASPQAGSPLTITESGTVGVTSTLVVFAQLGQPCLAGQGQEAAAGALHVDQRVIPTPGPFTATSRFTPATAGTYYFCGFLSGAAAGAQEDQSVSVAVTVAPAPPPPPLAVGAPGPAAGTPPAGSCVVPALARHTLPGAEHLLTAAGCSLGVILRPSARGLSRTRRKPGGKSLVLVVGSQFPVAGQPLRANQYVAIRLVLGRPPTARTTARTR